MKLCYWQGDVPNFGDDLNPWLWERVLPGFLDDDDDVLFLGIGSILYHDYPTRARKIVVGSGYGGYTSPPDVDERWHISFVRGPRTADVLRIDGRLGLGDAASLLFTFPELGALARAIDGPAFMPHWESAIDGAWPDVARLAGIRFIDPRWEPARVLREIAASAVLVTEALHGAIAADALRVPWVPFLPDARHRFKWHDWAESLGIHLRFAEPAASVWLEAALRLLDGHAGAQKRLILHGRKYDFSFTNGLFRDRAIKALRRAVVMEPHLSSHRAIERCTDAMLERLDDLRRAFPARTRAVSRNRFA